MSAPADDAAAFWRKFPITVSFLEPTTVQGEVLAYEDDKGKRPWPSITLRTPSGVTATVNCVQRDLLAGVVLACPNVGDEIQIQYRGEAPRAAPGMSPSKEFVVKINRRKVPSPGPGPGSSVRGSAGAPENEARTGKAS